MLEKLLRSGAEVKVLGAVLQGEALHLREIARRAGVSPPEAKRELGVLKGMGILTSERKGNLLLFHLNQACPFLPELRSLYLKTEGVVPELRMALGRLKGVKYAFIFGSMAAGKERPGSDIDLLVVGDISEDALSEAVFKVQKRLGKEINFILWSGQTMREKAGSPFLQGILKKEMVWLVGDEHEFGRIAGKGDNQEG